MITIDLRQEPLTLMELLRRAETDIVRVVSANGHEFMLVTNEESLEDEARRFGKSDKLMKFLLQRSQKPAVMSLSELKQRIGDPIR